MNVGALDDPTRRLRAGMRRIVGLPLQSREGARPSPDGGVECPCKWSCDFMGSDLPATDSRLDRSRKQG